MSEQNNVVETALAASKLPFIIQEAGLPIAFLPDGIGGGWSMKELNHLRIQPSRKKGATALHELDSFLSFVNIHKEPGTQIYVQADYAAANGGKVSFAAVLNGHQGAEPGFADFRADFTPRKTVDWENWLNADGKKMNQQDFARFLEDNIANIADQNPSDTERTYPAAAALLEFATNLEMNSTVRFRSAAKIQNGQVQFEYVEEGDAATKGKLEMFEKFGIGIRPFIGNGPAFFIEAFLRFRIDRNSGALSLWFDLNRPDKALETATQAMIARVQAEADVPVYFGAA